MSQDFSKLLDVKAEDIKAPPMIPAGEVTLTIKQKEWVKSKPPKETPGLEVTFIIGPYLNVIGDEAEAQAVVGKEITDTFWISKDPEKQETSRYMLKQFCENCGIPSEGRTLGEMVADLQGCQVVGSIRRQPSETNPERTFAKIVGYSKT
jgi:hypothetical protein